MSTSTQSRPATDWKENIAPDESERFERYADVFAELQRRFARGSSPGRALHIKGNVGVEAEFTVLPDLPEHARVGLFAAPATYRAYVRFSNGAAARQADPRPDLRGLAIKVVGVAGQKLLPGLEQAPTQDFTLAHCPVLPFHDADEFVSFVRAFLNPPPSILPALFRRFGLGTPGLLWRVARLALQPLLPLASAPYYSALPIQYGPYAARYAVVPHDPPAPPVPKDGSPEAKFEGLADRLLLGPVSYDFRIQFFRDERTTPIEDASVDWPESAAPFLTVARLVIPRQELRSPRGQQVAGFVDGLSFTAWHAQRELRPLGSMMRARRYAYQRSAQVRGAAPEPDGTELPRSEDTGSGRIAS